MKTKKIIAIILITMILAPAVVGCNKATTPIPTIPTETITDGANKEEVGNLENKDEIIEPTKENLLALGKKQTAGIKAVAEKYGLTTESFSEELYQSNLIISKDENDCRSPNCIGYQVDPLPTEDDVYYIFYGSYIDENNEPDYGYLIAIELEDYSEFSMEGRDMFRDLLIDVFGGDFNFKDLETRITKHLNLDFTEDTEDTKATSEIEMGSYVESISGGNVNAQAQAGKMLYYTITLRK